MKLRWPVVAVILASLLILLWYASTAAGIAAIWIRSETFTHGFLVLPISLWLTWRKREQLASLQPEPTFPVLILLAGTGFVWLFAELASVIGAAQFALVIMLQLAVWAILGTRIAKELVFPIAFLLFAVPAGEFLFPLLMSMTADFTVAALRVTGVPVYREGQQFVIPSGNWSVVEACSGLRYLIASLMVGALYAYLNYRSTKRRLLFVGASIVVPLVANWLRAYMIVMIGHLSNNRLAVGVDHIIYGWIFFGVVMLLMFWIGSWYREDDAPVADSGPETPRSPAALGFRPSRVTMAAVAVILVAGVWKPLYSALDGRSVDIDPRMAPLAAGSGWEAAPTGFSDWQPHYLHPRAVLRQYFRKDGSQVGLYVGFYVRQKQDEELINSRNVLVPSEDKVWAQTASGAADVGIGGEATRIRTAELRSPGQRLVVWNWYWINGTVTSNEYLAKLLLGYSKLIGRGDRSAIVAIFTPKTDTLASAEKALGSFVADMAVGINQALEYAPDRQSRVAIQR